MNQNTVTGNENQEKKSRQVLRAEKRKAEKAEHHAEIVANRIKQILDHQVQEICGMSFPDTLKNALVLLLLDIIELQAQSDFFSDLKGFSEDAMELLRELDHERTPSTEELINALDEKPHTDDRFMKIPSSLPGFLSESADEICEGEETIYLLKGSIVHHEMTACPRCGAKMWRDDRKGKIVALQHIPMGNCQTKVLFRKFRKRCSNPDCNYAPYEKVDFQADHHLITRPLQRYIELLLEFGHTNKEIARMTGVNEHLVKSIDKTRLVEKYTELKDGKRRLKQPTQNARILMIDEFLLHRGYQYATIIINGETGEALWLQQGKKKQVVYEFMEHVGKAFMEQVEAVACDMNSDFSEAFAEKYPHIRIVYDYFHIVKNFNDKVISEVRKEEQARLLREGRIPEAKRLKRSRYIVTASRRKLKQEDEKAEKEQPLQKGSELFHSPAARRTGGKLKRYEEIIAENKLLFICDVIKQLLEQAYSYRGKTITDRLQMGRCISRIVRLCRETKNAHFLWFAKLLETHRKGIVAHATYPIASGKMEGTNRKIKTVRRIAYGLPDDEYFFLKIMDFTHESPRQKARGRNRTVLPHAELERRMEDVEELDIEAS